MPRRKRYLKHVKYVASMPCCLRLYGGCEYGVQAHHLLKPMFGRRGMSMRSEDSNVIPLCYEHHSQLHRNGNEAKFFKEITGDEMFHYHLVKKIWFSSPHNPDLKQHHKPGGDPRIKEWFKELGGQY
tara:strand:+ start:156 stop:536 length:381 start_codon:yes stop_codon:yes gene_type:complete